SSISVAKGATLPAGPTTAKATRKLGVAPRPRSPTMSVTRTAPVAGAERVVVAGSEPAAARPRSRTGARDPRAPLHPAVGWDGRGGCVGLAGPQGVGARHPRQELPERAVVPRGVGAARGQEARVRPEDRQLADRVGVAEPRAHDVVEREDAPRRNRLGGADGL